MTRVFKFGGALLSNAKGIKQLASILEHYKYDNLAIVVSAIGKTTNALEDLVRYNLKKDYTGVEKTFIQIRRSHFELAESVFGNAKHRIYDKLNDLFHGLLNELKKEFDDRFFAYDQIVSYGEQLSSLIVHTYLKDTGLSSNLVDASTIIMTNANYTDAKINWEKTGHAVKTKIIPLLDENEIVLTQGFTGIDGSGNRTTLGREGSDFTAAILANILDANEVTIWKNVPGLMNADPNRFDDTIKLNKISYHEAIELAFYGASVIHPKTIQPVQQKNIPLFVRAFYDSKNSPTVISDDTSEDDKHQKIIVKDNQVLFSIASRDLAFIAEENLTRIFNTFSAQKVHVNLMQHSAVSFSVSFNEDQAKLQILVDELSEEFEVRYNTGLQLITIRFYDDAIIDKLTSGKKVFLEQKSRTTVQLLVR